MSDIITHYLTRDEAIRFIKKHRRARQCFIRMGTDLYTTIPDEDGTYRGYSDMTTLVPVGAKVAIDAVRSLISDTFAEKGAMINIGMSSNCIFIG